MTFLGLEARTDLPKVSYPTALDFFVFLSFAFIFATILQFAVVHYFTKYGSGECYFNFLEDSSSESGESEDEDKEHNSSVHQPPNRNNFHSLTRLDSCDMFGVIPLSRFEIQIDEEQTRWEALKKFKKLMTKSFWCVHFIKQSESKDEISTVTIEEEESSIEVLEECPHHQFESSSGASMISQNTSRCRRHSNQVQPTTIKRQKGRNFNSVSKIDKLSRVIFPLLFFVINLFYWYIYLSRSKRNSKQS